MVDEELIFVPNVHFELIPIKNLVSNQEYQRSLSTAHVKKTAEHFNLCQINPVKVSRRDGMNYVFNGQHTVETVALVSGSRETPVWCMIYDDLNYASEADIFANQMKYVKPLSPYEIFTANIEAGSNIQMTIKALVESYRLTIKSEKVAGSICAVSTLESIFNKFGYHVLDRALMLCVSTWEGDDGSLSANMLRGVTKLITAFGDSLKDDQFVEKIGKHSPREISRAAKERKDGSMGYAEAILAFYNKKMRYPLQQSKLYGTSDRRAPDDAGGTAESGDPNMTFSQNMTA